MNLTIIKNWAAVGAWMIVIFFFSGAPFSDENTSALLAPVLSAMFPSITGGQLEAIHLGLRKLGHLVEYFILAVLFMRALAVEFPRHRWIHRIGIAVLLASLYAASDEWHQSFVPGRTASVNDVIIDSCGAFLGALWFGLRHRKAVTR